MDEKDTKNRIDLGKELGGAGDQLLQDIREATKGELNRRQKQDAKAARTAAVGKSTRKYGTVAIVAAVVLLVVAYFVVFRPGSAGESQTRGSINGTRAGISRPTTVAPTTTPSAPNSAPVGAPVQPQQGTPATGQPASGEGYQTGM